MKLPRINCELTVENKQWLENKSAKPGKNQTSVINELIESERKREDRKK